MTEHDLSLTRLTADIVCAYVTNNPIPAPSLVDVMRTVHGALNSLAAGAAAPAPARAAAPKLCAAEVKRSIGKDALVSFIDGKPYKTLRRHITAHGMTPQTYRERFGLPEDYPLVAPSYSRTRSDIAKAIRLGVPGAMAKAA